MSNAPSADRLPGAPQPRAAHPQLRRAGTGRWRRGEHAARALRACPGPRGCPPATPASAWSPGPAGVRGGPSRSAPRSRAATAELGRAGAGEAAPPRYPAAAARPAGTACSVVPLWACVDRPHPSSLMPTSRFGEDAITSPCVEKRNQNVGGCPKCKPVALPSGYPFWTFLFFIISGVLTIGTEKKRSPNLVLDTRSSFYYVLKNRTIRASVQSEKV
ncbi:hypothetical protein CapIbe_013503 [Capra ibex]